MTLIINGNLEEQRKTHPEKKGWFIGHFLNPNSVFHNNNFEVKWNTHPKGKKKTVSSNKIAKSIAILISGKFILKFPEENKEVILSKSGDYVFWNTKTPHTTEAIEESTILTIRWPSIPNDQ